MPLNLNLMIEKTNLLFQETVNCNLTLTNSGNAPIQILHPAFNVTQPILRVVNVKSGAEKFFQLPLIPGDTEVPEKLAPGVSSGSSFDLLTRAQFPMAGDYEISAICEYDGKTRKAESNAVKISINRTTARGLTLVGADKPAFFGTWVNLVPEKPRLLFMRVDVDNGIELLADIAPGTLRTKAIVSTSINRAVAPGHWVGWIEEKKFYCLHYDPEQGATAVKSVDLPGDQHELATPLFSENAPSEPGGRPNGSAIFCLGLRDQPNAQIQLLNLTKNGVDPGGRIAIPGEYPQGIASHITTKNVRRLYFYQKQGENVALMQTAWPGYADPPGPPRKLGDFSGVFVAATSMMTYEDILCGVVFFLTGKDASRKLQYAYWTLPPDKPFSVADMGEVPFDMESGLSSATIRLNQSGHFGALLRTKGGQYRYFDRMRKVEDLPLPWGITPLPIELAFAKQNVPLFICAVENVGLSFIDLDGKPHSFEHH